MTDSDKIRELETEIEGMKKTLATLRKLQNSDDPDQVRLGNELVIRTRLDQSCTAEGLEALKELGIGLGEFRNLFHALWGACSRTSLYEKPAWGSLQEQLRAVGIRT